MYNQYVIVYRSGELCSPLAVDKAPINTNESEIYYEFYRIAKRNG